MQKIKKVILVCLVISANLWANPIIINTYNAPFISEYISSGGKNWSIELDKKLGETIHRKNYYLWVASVNKVYQVNAVFDTSSIAVLTSNSIPSASYMSIQPYDTIYISDTVTSSMSFIGRNYWHFYVRPVKSGNSLVNGTNGSNPIETKYPSMGKRFDYSTPWVIQVIDDQRKPLPSKIVDKCLFPCVSGDYYSGSCALFGHTDSLGIFRFNVSLTDDTLNLRFSGNAHPISGTGSYTTCWRSVFNDILDTMKDTVAVPEFSGTIGSGHKLPNENWRFSAIHMNRKQIIFSIGAPNPIGDAKLRIYSLSGYLLLDKTITISSSGTYSFEIETSSNSKIFSTGTYLCILSAHGKSIFKQIVKLN